MSNSNDAHSYFYSPDNDSKQDDDVVVSDHYSVGVGHVIRPVLSHQSQYDIDDDYVDDYDGYWSPDSVWFLPNKSAVMVEVATVAWWRAVERTSVLPVME